METEADEWSEETALQLVEHYKNYAVLWDPKDPNYYKKHVKLDAWKEISNTLKKTDESCRNKIISLLASYRRERARENKSKGTGKGTSEVYVSRWFAYDALQFLGDRNKPRKRTSTVLDDTDQEEEAGDMETVENLVEGEEVRVRETFTTPKINRQKKRDNDQLLKEALGVLNKAGERLDSRRDVNNGTKAFLALLGSKLDNYTQETQNSVQHAIFEIIMKADTGFYNFPQRNTVWNRSNNNATQFSSSTTIHQQPQQQYSAAQQQTYIYSYNQQPIQAHLQTRPYHLQTFIQQQQPPLSPSPTYSSPRGSCSYTSNSSPQSNNYGESVEDCLPEELGSQVPASHSSTPAHQ